MPFHMGPWEIGFILLIILIVFGIGKLPQVGSAIGKSIREFRNGQSGEVDAAEAKATRKKQRYATKSS